MEITPSKICGAVIAGSYLSVLAIVVVVHDGGLKWESMKALAGFVIILLVPLSLIWFPDDIGGWGAGGDELSDKETPPRLVSSIGWLLLVGGPLVAYFVYR